eukprot:scaffold195501_cov50-Attheya_sp.AAC.2
MVRSVLIHCASIAQGRQFKSPCLDLVLIKNVLGGTNNFQVAKGRKSRHELDLGQYQKPFELVPHNSHQSRTRTLIQS